jgi:glycolate oxidase iron-sulfur subunit
MKALAQLLRRLEEQLVICMRCGLCQAVCPLFAETGREADVARGKLALLDGLLQERFQDAQGVFERLDRCLLCGSCAANCPSGVKVLDIFIQARAILSGYLGLSPVKKAVFRGLLSNPQLFDRLLALGSRLQGLFVKPVDDLLGSSCSRFLSPLLAGRHFKPLAARPFHRRVPSLSPAPGPGRPRVAFFTGCLIDKVFPEVGEAALKILAHHRVGVVLPEDLGCCGIPALSAGDTATYDRLIRHNLARLAPRDVDYLVTACATCASTIKQIWPLMTQDLQPAEREQVAALAEKTLDLSQFLVDRVGLGASGGEMVSEPQVLTYHDPCHLKKSLGVAAQPRALLRVHPGYRFRELAEADWCCGCGGSFNLQHYEVSAAIGRRKRDHILRSGAATVATGCPACMMQLIDTLSQAGARIQVKHSAEIYAQALAED